MRSFKPQLHIDLETRSTVDLRKAGVYVYAAHKDTDVWCAGFALDQEDIQHWRPGDAVPHAIRTAVDNGFEILAHNAQFERVVWQHILTPRYGWPEPKLPQWRCTMVQAMAMSLPASLEDAALVLELAARKDMEGHTLAKTMSRPRRSRAYGSTGILRWFDSPDRVGRLIDYNRQDVRVERELGGRLRWLMPEELELWHLDQTINDRGVCVDLEFCTAASQVAKQAQAIANEQIAELTDGFVPMVTNPGRIKEWLRLQGVDVLELDKEGVAEALSRPDLPVRVIKVLQLRQAAAMSSCQKINALLAGCSPDGRARGLLQFHAASTGRWGGRRFQPQNLPNPQKGDDVDAFVEAVKTGDLDYIREQFTNPLRVVSVCLRGLLCAAPDHKLVVVDFSSIESRGLAWLAGEAWKVKEYRDYDNDPRDSKDKFDMYVTVYSRAFGVACEQVDSFMRQIGKVMDLSFGYQGGHRAFQKMAKVYRVSKTDEEAEYLKRVWREAHSASVQLWSDLEIAALEAVRSPGKSVPCSKLLFKMIKDFLFMRLPSGRPLIYPFPRIEQTMTPWGNETESLTYARVNSVTRQWERTSAYGGRLTENAVQGLSRDIMTAAMPRLEKAGYPIVFTVHDEVVCELPEDAGSVDGMVQLMTTAPAWADGFPIAAQGWSGPRYRKK